MSPLHWKMSHLYKGCASRQPCQCGLLVTDYIIQESVLHLLTGHETTAASPDVPEFKYFGYKIKSHFWFPWCLKGECQPSCNSAPLLVKPFTECFVICVGAPGPMPTRCFQGYSVIHATIWPNWLNVVYPVITIIQISKGKAEHISPSAQCCIKLFFRIALQSDWHVLLLNGIESEYWEALLCTLAMSRMATKLFNFPTLKSCSWKSTASHWNILLQIESQKWC